MKGKKRKQLLSVTFTFFISFVLIFSLTSCGEPIQVNSNPSATENALLVAEFWDVGQGDASFYTLPDGKTMLIDAANRGDGDKLVAYLKAKKIKTIDYVVATHPHADHIGGMSEIINAFEIGQIFAPKIAEKDIPTTKTYEDFLTAVMNKGLKITAAKQGATLFAGEDYKAVCLAPSDGEQEGLNNYSVVIKLTHGKFSFLLTGDAEKEIEEEILNLGYDINCDVLKVGHHGSSTSSSKKFLNAATPSIAVISCGEDNSYGHPHKETLNAFNSLKGLETLLRTDIDKTVIITSNGKDNLTYQKNHTTVVED